MSLEIFKNANNNVLFTGGGNVLKRPYDFGKSFKPIANEYIKISGLNISQYINMYSWMQHINPNNGNTYAWFNFRNTNNDNYCLNTWAYSTGYNGLNKNKATTGGSGNIGTYVGNYSSKYLVSNIFREDNTVTLKKDLINKINKTSTQTNDYAYDEIWLGAGRTSNGLTPNIYAYQTGFIQNRFALFSRELTIDELRYFFNNKSGNDFLSTTSILIDLRCNIAEILDFSSLQDSSDMRVGVRDYSGYNRHGQIMKLPAGILQEQLDYANTNLFVPSLS